MNGRFWERSSDQPTRCLIRPHVRKLVRVNDMNTIMYSLDPLHSFHSHEYGKN